MDQEENRHKERPQMSLQPELSMVFWIYHLSFRVITKQDDGAEITGMKRSSPALLNNVGDGGILKLGRKHYKPQAVLGRSACSKVLLGLWALFALL